MSPYSAMSWLKIVADEDQRDDLSAPYRKFVVALLLQAWRDASTAKDTDQRRRARMWLRSREAAELCEEIGLNSDMVQAKLDTLADDVVHH